MRMPEEITLFTPDRTLCYFHQFMSLLDQLDEYFTREREPSLCSFCVLAAIGLTKEYVFDGACIECRKWKGAPE